LFYVLLYNKKTMNKKYKKLDKVFKLRKYSYKRKEKYISNLII